MLKFPIFLFIPFIFGLQTPNFEEKPIIVHFEQILNEYRVSNGLNPVKIDYSIKEFTDLRSKSLASDYSHNGFNKNLRSYITNFTVGGENIAMLINAPNDNKPYWSSYIEDVGKILNKMSMGTSTNYDVAMYCFLLWKNSKSHNELLLNNKVKRFYLSYEKSKTFYYFCFIGLD
jgi:uncharacterized protein YkwD